MFPPIQTGSSFYARDVALALQARGHTMGVVTLRNPQAVDDRLPFSVGRLPAFHCPIPGFFKHLTVSSLFPGNYRRLVARVREFRPHWLFLVNHYLDIALLAVAAARLTRTPLACSIHTQLQATTPWRQRVLSILDRLICGRLILPRCNRIVAMDREIERYLLETHGAGLRPRIHIAPYGVSSEIPSEHSYELHGQLIGIGAVIEQRDFLAAVRVFHRLLPRFPGLRLKIVGHVYHRAAVKLARELGIADRVVFTGELSHDRVLEETARSDAYLGLFSGRYTGLGTAAIESMLMGVPAIANVGSDLFGPALLRDMENYVSADTSDLDAIACKTASILENAGLRRAIGQAGRRLVQEQLAWDRTASSLETSFAEL